MKMYIMDYYSIIRGVEFYNFFILPDHSCIRMTLFSSRVLNIQTVHGTYLSHGPLFIFV